MELRLENLTKCFQNITAVDHVSCVLGNGVYGLLGVNGAGKTTLMRMLCTLLAPSDGKILCEGMDICEMGAGYRKILGYLPQDFGVYPEFTVWDYMMYIASIKAIRPAVAKKRVSELLSQVGMEKYKNRKMKKLSGGMKRRVGIAQAMLNNPKVLILDEPTAGLDPNERVRFRNLISGLAENRLVLLSTHIVSDVEYIASKIFLMKDGTILHAGTSEEIIDEVPERVWTCIVPKAEAGLFLKNYKVINIKSMLDKTELRILSDTRPYEGAWEEKMKLEDVFLYYFGERAGEDNAAL